MFEKKLKFNGEEHILTQRELENGRYGKSMCLALVSQEEWDEITSDWQDMINATPIAESITAAIYYEMEHFHYDLLRDTKAFYLDDLSVDEDNALYGILNTECDKEVRDKALNDFYDEVIRRKGVKLGTSHVVVTKKHIARARKVLLDNGIEEDEIDTVLQALGYALLDVELDKLLNV